MVREKAFVELSPEERKRDFAEKNRLLSVRYEEIPAAIFYADFMFHDMEEPEFHPSIIMYDYGDEENDRKWKRRAVYIDEITDYCDRNDVAVNPCGYWNNYPRKKLMRRVYAFVMDIDEVRPRTLEFLLGMIEERGWGEWVNGGEWVIGGAWLMMIKGAGAFFMGGGKLGRW